MKKKKLQHLQLKKIIISNIQSSSIKGEGFLSVTCSCGFLGCKPPSNTYQETFNQDCLSGNALCDTVHDC